MLDYIVVGLGLAGIAVCEQLEKRNKTFLVLDDDSQVASKVAGGLYNPVVLKRFTLAWNAKTQMDYAVPFYEQLQKKIGEEIDHKIPVKRKFASIVEQNNWFLAADQSNLREYLCDALEYPPNKAITTPNGIGLVKHTGRILTAKLIASYKVYLGIKYSSNTLDYSQLSFTATGVHYNNICAKKIIFCEGFGLHQNPFFNYLPLYGNKGELLTIKAPDLKLDFVLKSAVFIIPIGGDYYRISATYTRSDKSNTITAAAREELLRKLKTMIACDFEVVDQVTGIRPTVKDRRPLVGRHPRHKQALILNGLGSRGVLMAPTMAKALIDFAENDSMLEKEIDIKRFEALYNDSASNY
jgi:glycine/D-amino acid oxidase-like deaminating enzyme